MNDPRHEVMLDGDTLTLEGVAGISRDGLRVRLSPESRERNREAYQSKLKLMEGGVRVYGMNTGTGSLRSVEIPGELREEYQRRLLRACAFGAGEPVSDEIVRAMLTVRANQLAVGGAGVHPELLDALVETLNEGSVPEVREIGSLGTGDLTSLAEVGLALLGERPFRDGRRRQSPITLGPRGGLMLMSSNAHAIGEAVLCLVDLRRLTRASESAAAVSFETARANVNALDARVHKARHHPGQIDSAEHLRSLLEGYVPGYLRIQDSFAFRCLPQVGGLLRDALDHLGAVLNVEINSAPENALLVDGEALTTGNFHAAPLATALDYVRNAIAQVAALSAARLTELMDPNNTGLNPFLAEEPGPDSGLMVVEYTVNAAVGELRLLASPAAAHSAVFISQGVENHASFAALAVRQTSRAVRLLSTVVAAELVAGIRAVRMRDKPPEGAGVGTVFDIAAGVLNSDTADRPMTEDLDAATKLVLNEDLV
ncbi:histidine ammonia-lyase [soil metagenome]